MRYATTLTLAFMFAMTAIAFVLEWPDVFVVLAVVTTIFIGLPVLNLASNFWFGETPPQVRVHDQYERGESDCRGLIGATPRDQQTGRQIKLRL